MEKNIWLKTTSISREKLRKFQIRNKMNEIKNRHDIKID